MKNLLFKQNKTLTLTTTALFLALGIIFPTIFHSLGLGQAFSPMHLPVLLCGLICGGFNGFIVGLITPFLCSLINGMPAIFPSAVTMSVELAVYGFSIGIFYELFQKSKTPFVKNFSGLFALLISMVLGRIFYGLVMWLCLALQGNPYSFTLFLSSVVLKTLPALALQIIAIPLIMLTLDKLHILQKYNTPFATETNNGKDKSQMPAILEETQNQKDK